MVNVHIPETMYYFWIIAFAAYISSIRIVYGNDQSQWPVGPYATPMSVYGCPESRSQGWRTGYMNLTAVSPMFDPPPDNDTATRDRMTLAEAHKLPVLGPYGEYSVQLNFCYKLGAHQNNTSGAWPNGNYAIYGTGNGCPLGFNEAVKIARLGKLRSWTADGDLPEIHLRKHPTMTELAFTICEHNDQGHTWETAFTDGIDRNFLFLKTHTGPCPVVNSGLNTTEVELSFLSDTANNSGLTENWSCCSYHVSSIQGAEVTIEQGSGLLMGATYLISKTLLDMGASNEYPGWPVIEEVYKQSDEVPWMLLDMSHSVIVKCIYITFHVDLSPHIEDATSVDGWPSVHVSQHKWSFLAHGAPQCIQTVDHYALDKTVSLCKTKLEGRYVALLGQEHDPANPRAVLYFFIQNIQLLVDEGTRFGSELGMRDFGIEDFQISAPTSVIGSTPQQSRLHGNGWCAHTDVYLLRDYDIFLQVDLLAPTTVEGILIRNVIFDDSVNSTGLTSFSVEYSDDDDGNKYSRYGLDQSREAPHNDSPSEVADLGLTVTVNGVCISTGDRLGFRMIKYIVFDINSKIKSNNQ